MSSVQLAECYFEELCLLCSHFEKKYAVLRKREPCISHFAKLISSQNITIEMLTAALSEVRAMQYPPDLRIAMQALEAPNPQYYTHKNFLTIDRAYTCYENGRYQQNGVRQRKFNDAAVYATYKKEKRGLSKDEFDKSYRDVCADIVKQNLIEQIEPEISTQLLEPNLEGMKRIADIAKQAFSSCHSELSAQKMTHEQLNAFYDQHLSEVHNEKKP